MVLFRGGKDTANMIIFTKNQSLLYSLLKLASRLAIRLLYREIRINNPEILQVKGPILLAANHPNSFYDSILLDTLFEEPVWALARGDAFRNKKHAQLLRQLNILPVFRTSEGTENLSINYQTFNACVELFKQNKIVTIYSEALCVNEWHLRPLKKGTARLAIQAWENGIPLRVIPVGINYSSFRLFGKNVHLNFGKSITQYEIPIQSSDGLRNQLFNQLLQTSLQQLVYEIPASNHQLLEDTLGSKVSKRTKKILFLPAQLGRIIHLPLYVPIYRYTLQKFGNTGHCDSVVSALLLFSYPFYLALVCSLLLLAGASLTISLVTTLSLPLLAWCHVKIKPQFDHQLN